MPKKITCKWIISDVGVYPKEYCGDNTETKRGKKEVFCPIHRKRKKEMDKVDEILELDYPIF